MGFREKIKPKGRKRDLDEVRFQTVFPYLVPLFTYLYDLECFNDHIQVEKDDTRNAIVSIQVNWEAVEFEKFYNVAVKYFREMSLNTPLNTGIGKMYVEHHVIPKFVVRDQSAENRIFIHTCEHGILHLIRWLYSEHPGDLSGFSSGARTEESIDMQRQKRKINPPNSPLPPPPPSKKIRAMPTITDQLRKTGQMVGSEYHTNSLFNRNRFSWFLCTQQIKLQHKSTKTYFYSPDTSDITQLEITKISKKLVELTPESTLKGKEHVLSEVFRGVKKSRGGWSIKRILIDNKDFMLQDLFDLFDKIEYILGNEELSSNDSLLTTLLMDKLNKNDENFNFPKTPTEQIVNFLILYHKTLNSLQSNSE